MEKRVFGKTGREVSRIGLGTWQLGTKWGTPFNDEEAMKILEAAYETGITFIDTADVYNGGNSELRANMDFIMICTYEEEGKNPELLLYKKR